MQYVGEVLGDAPRRGQPACSEFLAGRVEQFLDVGYPRLLTDLGRRFCLKAAAA